MTYDEIFFVTAWLSVRYQIWNKQNGAPIFAVSKGNNDRLRQPSQRAREETRPKTTYFDITAHPSENADSKLGTAAAVIRKEKPQGQERRPNERPQGQVVPPLGGQQKD